MDTDFPSCPRQGKPLLFQPLDHDDSRDSAFLTAAAGSQDQHQSEGDSLNHRSERTKSSVPAGNDCVDPILSQRDGLKNTGDCEHMRLPELARSK